MKLLLLLPLVFAATTRYLMKKPDDIDDFVRNAMARQHIPGVALVVLRNGQVIKSKGYGLASVDYDVPVSPATPFLLASMTKTFTAILIMMLAEEGKVNLDYPISKYLNDAPGSWKDITVRHLLTHTAGLRDRFEEPTISMTQWKVNYSEADMYESAKSQPLDASPGQVWQYSDQGYFLLGIIIEKITGKSYADVLQQRIFAPLDMVHSSTIKLTNIVKGMATGYTQVKGKWFHNTRRTDYGLVSHFGIVSSVEDLAKWDAALDSGKLVKRTTLESMWIPTRDGQDAEPYSQFGTYGSGWFVDTFNGHRSVGHGGSTGTAYLKFPEDRLTVVVLTNLEQVAGGDAHGIAKWIARQYIPELRWSSLRPISKRDSDLESKVKSLLDALAKGELPASIVTSAFESQLVKVLPQQKAGLAPLGVLQRVETLEVVPRGKASVVRLRVTFERFTGYALIFVAPDGRLGSLAIEDAE